MSTRCMHLGMLSLLLAQMAIAGAPASQPAETSETPPTSEPAKKEMPSLIHKLPDYTGDIWNRRYLTGDWGGVRTQLAEQGIIFDLSATQVFQGNAHGGKDTNNGVAYSGSADYTLKLDTARMGLWPGGLIKLRGETQFGHSINHKTGSILAPNMDALLPVPDDAGITTLSEFDLTQALSEKVLLMAGKLDLTTGDANVFAHDERTQFLNAGFRINPTLFPGGPYTTMGAGAVVLPTDWLTITTIVCDNDPEGGATMTGFNTAFHGRRWYSVMQEYDFNWKPFGQEGHQRFGWFWSSRDMALLDQDLRISLPGVALRRQVLESHKLFRAARIAGLGKSVGLDRRPDDWVVYYNFDQYFYTKPDDPTQGFGLFGRFGWSTGEANAFDQFYSLGVGGKGLLIPTRDKDTYGVGYYLANMSNDLPDDLNMHDEQGTELFYNIEITPWLHITPDLQIITHPGGGFQNRDVAIVYGVRAQMNF